MSSALHQSLTLVGYGDHNVFKYCFSCFEQSVSSANVQDDCSISHIFTPAYPDNVWFLKEGNQGLFSAASLLRAAKAGDIDAVKRNLRGHTGINSQDENGRTAILYAAWKGHNDVVSLLAEAHADVNLPDKDGFTACYTASYSGHTNVVDVLLRHGANPNIALAVEPYSVPLEMAATNGHPQTVERLLEGGALINREELSSTTRDQMELQLSSWPVRRVMRRW
jgi:ankyrin repeat protein